ncbi:MAG: hypothetical protein IJS39_10515 [Synergistaceae bacterium]|nr:hypothetical protein [Synergistaceae bacterium]
MNVTTLERGNTALEIPCGLDDEFYDRETSEDIAEFEDILAHPERHKGYSTAREMLRDMGLI